MNGRKLPKERSRFWSISSRLKKNLLSQNWEAVRRLIQERPGSVFPLIHEILSDDKNDFTVTELCLFCGVSRSGYYSWLKAEKKLQEREKQDEKDFKLILRAYKKGGFHKGSRRIQMPLTHDNFRMNRKKISD